MNIRILTPTDAPVLREIRLQALQEVPSAYGSSYEEEVTFSMERWEQRLQGSLATSFGAFIDEALVGTNALVREPHLKTRHRASIVAMYTLPHLRGQGIGKALLQAAIDHARTLEGIEDINLAVTVGNDSAKGLYQKMGFQTYSYDPRFLRIDDQYFDLEWMILSLANDPKGKS